MPITALGYERGAVLREVTLAEARSWDCNRCGDCCDSSRPDVLQTPDGLPRHVWEHPDTTLEQGSQTADPHRYDQRFKGKRLIQPIARVDGGLEVAADFERDADGRAWTSYRCAALQEFPEGAHGPDTACAIYHPPPTYAESEEGLRPYNCGAFPVFGLEVDDSIVQHGSFIPPTGALPRCSWYGIRVVGPWKDTPNWNRAYALHRQAWETHALDVALANMRAPR